MNFDSSVVLILVVIVIVVVLLVVIVIIFVVFILVIVIEPDGNIVVVKEIVIGIEQVAENIVVGSNFIFDILDGSVEILDLLGVLVDLLCHGIKAIDDGQEERTHVLALIGELQTL